MDRDVIVADIYCLASVCVRMRIDIGQIAVMAYMFRHEACEPLDVAQATGMSKSRLYRQLDYMRRKGDVRKAATRKDFYRRSVQLWELTEQGRRTAMTFELLYREHVAKLIEGRI